MSTYFTADLHLGHARLAQTRGFATVHAHDAHVMAGLYGLNPDTDTLWVLGDICAGSPESAEHALEQLSTVRVPMHVVLGNHDPAHAMYGDVHSDVHADMVDLYAAVFETAQAEAQVRIGDRTVSLSHFPFADTPDPFSRKDFSRWQLTDDGERWLIHGHTHSRIKCPGERSVCVSLEAWGLRPASEHDVAVLMSGRRESMDAFMEWQNHTKAPPL